MSYSHVLFTQCLRIIEEKGGLYVFLLLTGMLISFVVGTTLLVNGEIVYGSIANGLGILLLYLF